MEYEKRLEAMAAAAYCAERAMAVSVGGEDLPTWEAASQTTRNIWLAEARSYVDGHGPVIESDPQTGESVEALATIDSGETFYETLCSVAALVGVKVRYVPPDMAQDEQEQ